MSVRLNSCLKVKEFSTDHTTEFMAETCFGPGRWGSRRDWRSPEWMKAFSPQISSRQTKEQSSGERAACSLNAAARALRAIYSWILFLGERTALWFLGITGVPRHGLDLVAGHFQKRSGCQNTATWGSMVAAGRDPLWVRALQPHFGVFAP